MYLYYYIHTPYGNKIYHRTEYFIFSSHKFSFVNILKTFSGNKHCNSSKIRSSGDRKYNCLMWTPYITMVSMKLH